MSDRLRDKTAIVSGAARGLGAAHVHALVREGANVVAFDLSDGDLQSITADHRVDNVSFIRADVTSAEDWTRVVGHCLERFGMVDILVNNAGICPANPIDQVSEEEFRRVVDVNQVGTFLGMSAVAPVMQAAGHGSIVNISSTAGCVGFADLIAYTATKWAVRGMTRAAALELASAGIRVNCICPGDTDTPMLQEVSATSTAAAPPAADLPFGRWARPEEISAALIFLASDESSYVSGADLVVDGAFTAA